MISMKTNYKIKCFLFFFIFCPLYNYSQDDGELPPTFDELPEDYVPPSATINNNLYLLLLLLMGSIIVYKKFYKKSTT
jgi:hypothetical protein